MHDQGSESFARGVVPQRAMNTSVQGEQACQLKYSGLGTEEGIRGIQLNLILELLAQPKLWMTWRCRANSAWLVSKVRLHVEAHFSIIRSWSSYNASLCETEALPGRRTTNPTNFGL